MTLLCDLAKKYGTDKGAQENGGWGYTPAYQEVFDNMGRDQVRNVLEIGICGYRDIPNNVVGASLFMWRDAFPNAQVFGIDNDSRFIFNDQQRISTAQADAYNPASLQAALNSFGRPKFEFICDDAIHDPVVQMLLVGMLWPFLVPGGVYAIEDVCPYKCTGGNLEYMINGLLLALPECGQIREVTTHKDERLLLLFKV